MDHFLEARTEILETISWVFWEKRSFHKDIIWPLTIWWRKSWKFKLQRGNWKYILGGNSYQNKISLPAFICGCEKYYAISYIKATKSRKVISFGFHLLKNEQNSCPLKFIYSEKATKFCKISILFLSYVVPVKSRVEISQNFVAFSEYRNFNFSRWIDCVFICVFWKCNQTETTSWLLSTFIFSTGL